MNIPATLDLCRKELKRQRMVKQYQRKMQTCSPEILNFVLQRTSKFEPSNAK